MRIKALMTALLLAALCFNSGCDGGEQNILLPQFLQNNVAGISLTSTNMVQEFGLNAGHEYTLGVDLGAMDAINNRIVLYYGNFRNPTQLSRLAEFKVDPALGNNDEIDVSAQNGQQFWTFTIPDIETVDEVGFLRLFFKYTPSGSNSYTYHYDYLNLNDHTPDSAMVLNNAGPLNSVQAGYAHYGALEPGASIQARKNQLIDQFNYATKGYFNLQLNDLGQFNFPADNANLNGVVHDYSNWWNGLNHDLTGTSLLPLNINNPDDFELIKMAWYDSGHRPLYTQDAKAVIGFTGNKTFVIGDMLYWSAGSQTGAYSPVYNSYGFSELFGGIERWGKNPNFGKLQEKFVTKIALHEMGHNFAMTHPPTIYHPQQQNYEHSVSHSTFDIFSNLMHQGNLDDDNTDRFYTDGDLQKIGNLSQTQVNEPALRIPYVEPIGQNIAKAQYAFKGQKDPDASIIVNGVEQVPADNLSTWELVVQLDMGENLFEISEMKNGRISHPLLAYVHRIGVGQPNVPLTSINLTNIGGATGGINKIFSFEISSSAFSGLSAMWWWIEKEVSPGNWDAWPVVHWRAMNGTSEGLAEYRWSFSEPGNYKIRARSRDLAYPVSGEEHQSNIAEVAITVN